jgi:Family of unknown function (DUF6541)
MGPVSLIVALAVWGLLPGVLLWRALDRSLVWPEVLAAAPGSSLALMATASYLTSFVGLGVSPLGVLPATVLLLGAVYLLAWRYPTTCGVSAQPARNDARWVPWLAFGAPIAVFLLLAPMREIPVFAPTLHDGLDHARYFRLIVDTQSLDRLRVMAPPFYADHTPSFYPWGLHAWLALVAQTTKLSPMQVFTPGLVFVSCAVPLGVYSLSARFLGPGWISIAASWMTIFVWELPFEPWRWGGYAFLAGAVALLPVLRISLAAFLRPAAFFAAAVTSVGVLAIHPSQAWALLLFVSVAGALLVIIGELPRSAAWAPLALVALFALVGTLGPRFSPPLAEFVVRAHRQAEIVRGQAPWQWPLGVYGIFIRASDGRVWVFALAVLGAVASIRDRRGRVFVALHAVLSLMLLLAPKQTWLTLLFYHEPERVGYLECVCIPALAALGLDVAARFVPWALRDGEAFYARRTVLFPTLLMSLLALFGRRHFERGVKRLTIYARGPLSVTDHRILADFEAVAARVPEGEVVFNTPYDAGVGMPFTGRRFVYCPYGSTLLARTDWPTISKALNRPDRNFPIGIALLREEGIHYVFAPLVGDDNARHYAAELAKNPALSQIHRSDTAVLFRVRRSFVRALGPGTSRDVALSGFYGVENSIAPGADDVAKTFRRTTGDAHVRVLHLDPQGSRCRFAVAALGSEPYQVLLNGDELRRIAFGFQIPEVKLGEQVLDFEIRSPTTTASKRGPLGLRVTAIFVYCDLE